MKVILIIFMVLMTSCDSPLVENYPYRPDKESLAIEVRNKTMAQLKRDYDLYPCGIGSEMMYQIKMLALAFNYYKEVDITEARELLVDAGTLFLNIINGNEQIRPFLENYPFKPENIQVRIFLQNLNGTEFGPDKLCIISMIDGILKYKTQPNAYPSITVYKETFEEAVLKLGPSIGSQSVKTL